MRIVNRKTCCVQVTEPQGQPKRGSSRTAPHTIPSKARQIACETTNSGASKYLKQAYHTLERLDDIREAKEVYELRIKWLVCEDDHNMLEPIISMIKGDRNLVQKLLIDAG